MEKMLLEHQFGHIYASSQPADGARCIMFLGCPFICAYVHTYVRMCVSACIHVETVSYQLAIVFWFFVLLGEVHGIILIQIADSSNK